MSGSHAISEDTRALAIALGRRLAQTAEKLRAT
jgi:hypothetical protein